METFQTRSKASSTNCDFDTEAEWLDDEVTDGDLALTQGILLAVAHDDVVTAGKLVRLLPTLNLSLESVSFHDTDSDQLYSLLGLAKCLGANRVAAYLMSCGLNKDFIDDEAFSTQH
jgi:hypothetical protein